MFRARNNRTRSDPFLCRPASGSGSSALVRTAHLADAAADRAPIRGFLLVSGIAVLMFALRGLEFRLVAARAVQGMCDFTGFHDVHGVLLCLSKRSRA